MAKHRAKPTGSKKRKTSSRPPDAASFQRRYHEARDLAVAGQIASARVILDEIAAHAPDLQWQALILNDRGVLATADGDLQAAGQWFDNAVALDTNCQVARQNLAALSATNDEGRATTRTSNPDTTLQEPSIADVRKARIAILSFLFNWPSTGGGIVHTYELIEFLRRVGFHLHHIFARLRPGESAGSLAIYRIRMRFWSFPTMIGARTKFCVDFRRQWQGSNRITSSSRIPGA